MKYIQFISEAEVLDIVKKVLDSKGKDFVKTLNQEFDEGCLNEDGYENFVMDIMDHPEEYPAYQELINSVAKELNMEPEKFVSNANLDVLFRYYY